MRLPAETDRAANPLGHEALLTLARKVEAAARDDDRERLRVNALHLLEALVDHVGAERPALLDLPPDTKHVVLGGQQQVIDMLVALAVAAQTPGPCRCEHLAQELLAQLSVQAHDEHDLDADLPQRGHPS